MIEHGNPQSLVAEQTCNGKKNKNKKSNNDQQTMTDMNYMYFDSNSKNLFYFMKERTIWEIHLLNPQTFLFTVIFSK